MKLVYDVIEDVYDDTTQIRTMTEQAQLPSGEWLKDYNLFTTQYRHGCHSYSREEKQETPV